MTDRLTLTLGGTVRMSRGLIVTMIACGVIAIYLVSRGDDLSAAYRIMTATVTRGPIVSAVGASGRLEPVETVPVGAQVSGRIAELAVDFSALVRRGQVLARLDPTLIQAQIEQARTALVRAQAERERIATTLADADVQFRRTQSLWDSKLVTDQDLDAARMAVRVAQAQVRSADAQVGQAEALLQQRAVDLERAVIRSPIDGFVLSREVEVGQTVAAGVEVPTMFVLAADLTAMRIVAQITEDDIGRIRPDQAVTFSVDAYPGEAFEGRVAQVRLTPVVERGVVRYPAIIDVENPDFRLTPGMTASLAVETGRRDDAVRVPSAGLRFDPDDATFDVLGQDPPWEDEEDPYDDESGLHALTEEGTYADRVWLLGDSDELIPVDVVVGLSDDTAVELVTGDLAPGDEIVTRVIDEGATIREMPVFRPLSPFAPRGGRRYR